MKLKYALRKRNFPKIKIKTIVGAAARALLAICHQPYVAERNHHHLCKRRSVMANKCTKPKHVCSIKPIWFSLLRIRSLVAGRSAMVGMSHFYRDRKLSFDRNRFVGLSHVQQKWTKLYRTTSVSFCFDCFYVSHKNRFNMILSHKVILWAELDERERVTWKMCVNGRNGDRFFYTIPYWFYYCLYFIGILYSLQWKMKTKWNKIEEHTCK